MNEVRWLKSKTVKGADNKPVVRYSIDMSQLPADRQVRKEDEMAHYVYPVASAGLVCSLAVVEDPTTGVLLPRCSMFNPNTGEEFKPEYDESTALNTIYRIANAFVSEENYRIQTPERTIVCVIDGVATDEEQTADVIEKLIAQSVIKELSV